LSASKKADNGQLPAYALRRLGTREAVPELAKMLEQKEESAPTVTELVCVSHSRNCLFCHRPIFDGSGAKVPIPEEPSSERNNYGSANPRELAVDPGATCLHQDFSVILPVDSYSGSQQNSQRFDFTTRVRPAKKVDDRRLNEMNRERQKAVFYAIWGIVARKGMRNSPPPR
jgi:hypothetical protein